MLVDEFHPEDIKAAVRKRYGSMAAFERAKGLCKQSTSQVFRRHPSARTEKALRAVLREAGMLPRRGEKGIITNTDSSGEADAHRQNCEVA